MCPPVATRIVLTRWSRGGDPSTTMTSVPPYLRTGRTRDRILPVTGQAIMAMAFGSGPITVTSVESPARGVQEQRPNASIGGSTRRPG
jgi:hypothetical protein